MGHTYYGTRTHQIEAKPHSWGVVDFVSLHWSGAASPFPPDRLGLTPYAGHVPVTSSRAQLERNLQLYSAHQLASRLLFWFPTSILYFLSQVSLGTMFRLNAVYFLAVVVLEVPSGWMSDRLGRVLTLRIGAASWVAAYALFVFGGSATPTLAIAQVLVALGFASQSGTDSTFHFDTLEALDRSSEFERRESRISRNALMGTTIAAIAGGSLGLIDLRLPYAASLIAALTQLWLTTQLTEPVAAHTHREITTLDSGPTRLADVLRYLASPHMAWIFLFMIVQQPLEGLALDQMQPWLAELTGNTLSEAGRAPLYSGLLLAVISLVGALSAGSSHLLRAKLGLRGALGLLAGIEASILIAMAIAITPWFLPLLALRSTQAGAAPVIVSSAVAPLLAKNHRATFLSLGSLAGRGAYGVTLLALGTVEIFDDALRISAIVGIASVGSLGIGHVLTRPKSVART